MRGKRDKEDEGKKRYRLRREKEIKRMRGKRYKWDKKKKQMTMLFTSHAMI